MMNKEDNISTINESSVTERDRVQPTLSKSVDIKSANSSVCLQVYLFKPKVDWLNAISPDEREGKCLSATASGY